MKYKITIVVSVKDEETAESLKDELRAHVEDVLAYENEDLIACTLEKELE